MAIAVSTFIVATNQNTIVIVSPDDVTNIAKDKLQRIYVYKMKYLGNTLQISKICNTITRVVAKIDFPFPCEGAHVATLFSYTSVNFYIRQSSVLEIYHRLFIFAVQYDYFNEMTMNEWYSKII